MSTHASSVHTNDSAERELARKRGQLGQITDVTCHNAKLKDKLTKKNEYERTFKDKIRKKTTHLI